MPVAQLAKVGKETFKSYRSIKLLLSGAKRLKFWVLRTHFVSCLLTFFEKKVSKETSNATAPLNSLLSGATAIKVLGALHPLRVGAPAPATKHTTTSCLPTSFSQEAGRINFFIVVYSLELFLYI